MTKVGFIGVGYMGYGMVKNLLKKHNVFIFAHKNRKPINKLVKYKFEKMFLEDKLFTALPNVTSWLLTNFNQLNRYANKT